MTLPARLTALLAAFITGMTVAHASRPQGRQSPLIAVVYPVASAQPQEMM